MVQLHERLSERTQVTEKWTRKAWHKRAMCENKSLNFTALFVPHAQPHFPGDYWRVRKHGVNSTVSYLDSIVDEKLVIVAHMFTHLKHYRSEIFQDRMNALSRSVGRLLDRSKNVRVLVKGPHTYFDTFAYKYYMYRAIIKEAFKDLYDRVVFMEQGDMTLAKHNLYTHPDSDTVREAVRQLLGFIC